MPFRYGISGWFGYPDPGRADIDDWFFVAVLL